MKLISQKLQSGGILTAFYSINDIKIFDESCKTHFFLDTIMREIFFYTDPRTPLGDFNNYKRIAQKKWVPIFTPKRRYTFHDLYV